MRGRNGQRCKEPGGDESCFHGFVFGLLIVVEPPLHRPVAPEERVPALARPRLDPVAFLPGGRPTTTQIWNRLNYSSRTLGDLLTLNSCQNEQDSMTLFLTEFRPPGQQRHYKCLAQDERGCRVTAREPPARDVLDDPAKDEVRDDGEQQHHRHRLNRIKPVEHLELVNRVHAEPDQRHGRRRDQAFAGGRAPVSDPIALSRKRFPPHYIIYLAPQT